MTSYYDDNYGHWEGMDDPDMVAFYHRTQDENVLKQCVCCGGLVRIRPSYDKCNGCTDTIERGGDPWRDFTPATAEDMKALLEDDRDEPSEDWNLSPLEDCFVCGGQGEDCSCDGGSTDEGGDANYCYDCNAHIDDCNCDRGEEDYPY